MKKDQITNFLAAVAAGIIIAGASILGMNLAMQYNVEKMVEIVHEKVVEIQEEEASERAAEVERAQEMSILLDSVGQ